MYALGVVLYELLTGRRPFVADTLPQMIGKILGEAPEPPSRWRMGITPEMDRAVLKALAKRPEDRFESWVDFALELAAIGRLSEHLAAVEDDEKIASLKQVAELAQLPPEALAELSRAARWRRQAPYEPIIREGENGASLYFIASGEAKVTRNGRLLNVVRAGEWVGDIAFARRGNVARSATVEPLTDAVIAELTSEAVASLSAPCQLHLMRALMGDMAERLAMSEQRSMRAA
jgi:CRP-like cAMP-binding protein